MTNKNFAKVLAVAGFAAAVVAANADSFYVTETGSYSQTGLNISSSFTTSATLLSTLTAPVATGTLSVTESSAATASGVAATGTLTLKDFSGDSLIFGFTGTVYSGFGQSLSAHATLTSTSGTGAYAAYTSGTGDFSFTFAPGSIATGSVEGTVNAVPEPATYAVLGLGVGALLLRRRS